MKFFSFWRSLASFRVRIALNLKNVPAEVVFVDLDANAHREPGYRKINPQMALPALVEDDGTTLFQSLAILEYLDEKYPSPPLLPADINGRARVRALALMVACAGRYLHGRAGHRCRDAADRPENLSDGEAHLRNRDGAAGVCEGPPAGAAGHAGGDAAEGLKARLAARLPGRAAPGLTKIAKTTPCKVGLGLRLTRTEVGWAKARLRRAHHLSSIMPN